MKILTKKYIDSLFNIEVVIHRRAHNFGTGCDVEERFRGTVVYIGHYTLEDIPIARRTGISNNTTDEKEPYKTIVRLDTNLEVEVRHSGMDYYIDIYPAQELASALLT